MSAIEPSPWNYSAGKRLFDIAAALLVLLISLPLTVVIAAAVKLNSRGPVLFRQARVGRDGKSFVILKFRTMASGESAGLSLTRKGDSRVTGIGRALRNWKLDELPQFLNVLRGDMSLVGPRPDLAKYTAVLGAERQQFLSLRPGITGAASLRFRNEESILAGIPEADLERVYTSQLFPQKVDIDLAYARSASLRRDLELLCRTFAAVLQ